MALTDRYVTTTGSGTYAASTSIGTPMSITTAFTNAAAGDRINIKSGTYTLSTTQAAGVGTTTGPIVWRGYNTSPGDLDVISRTSANGALTTTNFPVLDFSGTAGTRLTTSNFNNLMNLDVRLNFSGNALVTANDCVVYNCKVSNAGTGTAIALYLGQRTVAYGCDAVATGGSSRAAIGSTDTQGFIAIGCRADGGVGSGFYGGTTTGTGVIAFCVASNCKGQGIEIASGPWLVLNCTVTKPYTGATGSGVYFASGNTFRNTVVNSHLTDLAAYGIDPVATTNAVFAAYNRTRGNTSGAVNLSGTSNSLLASILNHVTTGSGTSSDFTDYTNSNFNLISAAPGKAAGQPLYLDLGALQRQESGGGFVIGS